MVIVVINVICVLYVYKTTNNQFTSHLYLLLVVQCSQLFFKTFVRALRDTTHNISTSSREVELSYE
jgi:hypothetical protein